MARRVSRNRVSGAKGGRALAAKKRAQVGEPTGETLSSGQAAKAKTKDTESAKPSVTTGEVPGLQTDTAIEEWFTAIKEVTGDIFMDAGVVRAWLSEDVDLKYTVLPTISSVLNRELSRTGKPPKRLAYYRDAVLEAAKLPSARQKKQMSKTEFQLTDETHWRQLLGDPNSRFRGDYMAQNWFIPGDHPDFMERGLGPNPRFSKNRSIPATVYSEYARRWLWL